MLDKEIKESIAYWEEKAKDLEERLAPYQDELSMEEYLEGRISYYDALYNYKGYGKEQKKVLQEALEYFIHLRNK